MKNNKAFDIFKTAMLQIDESAFINLSRNYLGAESGIGRLKLIEKLAGYLEEEAVGRQLVAMISREDAEMLSVIAYLGQASEEAVQAFYLEKPPFAVKCLLDNLRERLWLLRCDGHYMVNPLLAPLAAKEHIINFGLLLPAVKAEGESPSFWIDDSVLMAFWSLSREQRRRSRIQGFFPLLSAAQLELLEEASEGLELFTAGGEINFAVIRPLALLDKKSRLAYVLAGYTDPLLLEELASFFTEILKGYGGRLLTREMLARIFYIKNQMVLSSAVIDRIINSGLFLPQGNMLLTAVAAGGESSKIIIQSDFAALVMPDTLFSAGFAAMSVLERCDTVSLYRLTQESLCKALSSGFSLKELLEELDGVLSSALPQNIEATLRHWQNYYEQAVLYKGYVLALSEERQLDEVNKELLSLYMAEEIAPGIFFLRKPPDSLFFEKLSRFGINSPLVKESGVAGLVKKTLFKNQKAGLAFYGEAAAETFFPEAEHEEFINGLLTKTEDSEWRRRIRRKVVLSENQLRGQLSASDEVRGFNFQGKLHLIEHAIAQDAYIEVDIVKEFDVLTLMLKPLGIKKRENERFVQVINTENFKKLTIPVHSFAAVRFIRKSLL
jgi:hypothetical protein